MRNFPINVENQDDGVRISWDPPPSYVERYDVYRRLEGRMYGQQVPVVIGQASAGETSFLDTGATVLGGFYRYFMNGYREDRLKLQSDGVNLIRSWYESPTPTLVKTRRPRQTSMIVEPTVVLFGIQVMEREAGVEIEWSPLPMSASLILYRSIGAGNLNYDEIAYPSNETNFTDREATIPGEYYNYYLRAFQSNRLRGIADVATVLRSGGPPTSTPTQTHTPTATFTPSDTPIPTFTPTGTPPTATATLPPIPGSVAADRDALVAFYYSMRGDLWDYNENWLSDRPLNEWAGVETDGNGRVTGLDISVAYSDGLLPPEIGQLSALQELYLHNGYVSGPLPQELAQLQNLRSFTLFWAHMTGPFPLVLTEIRSLETLIVPGNYFTGPIPPEIGQTDKSAYAKSVAQRL